ncbi:hypothetical protein [uncultured Albimonas sp.]|uniref:hypothetical protein n=1 Tax=uncultured Albimonas sp. TaxID=1331701 RepID=UPI0030EDA65D|tara:strand:+ start:1087 stop:1383 length:297 start_codon:yes stop_codon:yes gene_type:complete
MTPAIAVVLMLVVGWVLPLGGRKLLGGRRGVWIGGVLALIATVGVAWVVGEGVAALREGDPRAEFDKAFNAWKLMILYIPAVCLHLARQVPRAGDAER